MPPTMTLERADTADVPVMVLAMLRKSWSTPVAEDALFALLGRVDLDQAHSTHRLSQAAAHLLLDPPSLPEDGSQLLEGESHRGREKEQQRDRADRQLPVEPEKHDQRDGCGEEPSDEVHQARPDEVADTLRVVHDARDEAPALGLVEKAHGEMNDVCLDRGPHIANGPLGRDAHGASETEGAGRVHESGEPGRCRERHEQLSPALPDHVIDEEFRRSREHEAREPPHHHERQAHQQRTAVRSH